MSGARITCPKCGQKAAVKIVYGFPSDELFQKAEQGKIALGGCAEEIDAPDRQCLNCGHNWSKKTARE